MNRFVFALIACFLAVASYGQSVDAVSLLSNPSDAHRSFKIVNIGLGVGPYEDVFTGMTAEMLLGRVQDPGFQHTVDLSQYERAAGNVVMSGGNLGFFVELHPYSAKRQGWHFGQSLRLGLSMNFDRELMIDYYGQNGGDQYYNRDWVGYCLIENEVQLSVDYLFSLKKKRLSVYGGPGFNMASTFNNLLIILDGNSSWGEGGVKTKGSLYSRFYGVAGVGLNIFTRLQFFGEFRPGFGMYFTQGERALAHGNMSGQFGFRYRVMK